MSGDNLKPPNWKDRVRQIGAAGLVAVVLGGAAVVYLIADRIPDSLSVASGGLPASIAFLGGVVLSIGGLTAVARWTRLLESSRLEVSRVDPQAVTRLHEAYTESGGESPDSTANAIDELLDRVESNGDAAEPDTDTGEEAADGDAPAAEATAAAGAAGSATTETAQSEPEEPSASTPSTEEVESVVAAIGDAIGEEEVDWELLRARLEADGDSADGRGELANRVRILAAVADATDRNPVAAAAGTVDEEVPTTKGTIEDQLLETLKQPDDRSEGTITRRLETAIGRLMEYRGFEGSPLLAVDPEELREETRELRGRVEEAVPAELQKPFHEELDRVDDLPDGDWELRDSLEAALFRKRVRALDAVVAAFEARDPEPESAPTAGLSGLYDRFDRFEADLTAEFENHNNAVSSAGNRIPDHFLGLAQDLRDRAEAHAEQGDEAAAEQSMRAATDVLEYTLTLYKEESLRDKLQRI